jgi:hypothetical protein
MAGEFAKKVRARHLVLSHLSNRYTDPKSEAGSHAHPVTELSLHSARHEHGRPPASAETLPRVRAQDDPASNGAEEAETGADGQDPELLEVPVDDGQLLAPAKDSASDSKPVPHDRPTTRGSRARLRPAAHPPCSALPSASRPGAGKPAPAVTLSELQAQAQAAFGSPNVYIANVRAASLPVARPKLTRPRRTLTCLSCRR